MVIIHQNNLEESMLLKMSVPRFGTKWLFSGSWPMDWRITLLIRSFQKKLKIHSLPTVELPTLNIQGFAYIAAFCKKVHDSNRPGPCFVDFFTRRGNIEGFKILF